MNENESNDFTHSTRAILGFADARCEDHRIRPREVSDECIEMSVLMRLGGEYSRYYLRARVVYSDDEDEAGHRVEIRQHGGDVVDTLEVDWATAQPDDLRDATQAICETYTNAAEDWYGHAVAADEAGEGR